MGEKITVPHVLKMKQRGEMITCLTAYDYAFARILGYSKEDFMGKAAREYNRYTDEANAALVERVFNEVYRTGLPARVETKVIHTDGSVRFVDISVALFRDASGKPVGFRGITRDVTDRKSVEQALNTPARDPIRADSRPATTIPRSPGGSRYWTNIGNAAFERAGIA